MLGRLDRVQIALSRTTVEISWGAREELLERLRPSLAGHTIVAKFRAAGATDPVRLKPHERATLLDVVGQWLDEVGADNAPREIFVLRNELLGEHDGGLLDGHH